MACYWLRGLTPNRGKRNNEVEIHEAITWSTPRFDEVLQASKLSYTDGTSGVGEVPIYIRPSAFGAVTFKYRTTDDGKPEIYDIQMLGGQVPGEQTVPRAETWAAIVLLTRVNANAVARVGIDAAYVVNGVQNRHKLVKGRNGDLWGLFFAILDLRIAESCFAKVASHIEDVGARAVETDFATICDVIGNALADEAADLAAKLMRPTPAKCKKIESEQSEAFLVCVRIRMVQARLWERTENAMTYELPEEAEQEAT